MVWIIRGCIDYFDQLDNEFLGIGNKSGIPSMQADHFANNLYRLNNAMKYLKDYGFKKNIKLLMNLILF